MKRKKFPKVPHVHNKKSKTIKIIKVASKKKNKVEKILTVSPLVIDVQSKKIRKRRKKGSGVIYFSQDTENAIIQFNNTENKEKRDEIYNSEIKYPFEKLVENVFNTFKFSYFETGPIEVQKETITHLVANIHKFEAGRGKAFSYFSIIAKHYLIALNNSTYKRFNQHVDISEEKDEHTVQLQSEDKHYKEVETAEFMQLMLNFWDKNVNKIFNKPRDLAIAQAVIELFRQTQNISLFNKKALYLYIREISDCKTQQITKIINKMKPYQMKLYTSYINDGIGFNNLYDIPK